MGFQSSLPFFFFFVLLLVLLGIVGTQIASQAGSADQPNVWCSFCDLREHVIEFYGK